MGFFRALIMWYCLSGMAAVYALDFDICMAEKLKAAPGSATVGELKVACEAEVSGQEAKPTAGDQPVSTAKARLLRERDTQWLPYILTAHKQNYILPYTHVDEQNPIYTVNGGGEAMDQVEAKFQLSIKIPLAENDLFVEGDSLDAGFTLKSFWQVYNSELSAPFRETNYNPEIFYTMPLELKSRGADTALRLGLEHESNGRSQLLSRSWNRVYTQIFYAKNNYLISLKPWYRLPEDKKDDVGDPSGDDNPDIDDYMGYFEISGVVTYDRLEFSTMLRNNLRDENYGALELGLSFPLWGRVRGYAQYFNGYGESLIDYNHRIERFGLGFLVTDLM